MKRYKAILFDLDGTISNSALGVYNGIKYAYNKYGKDIAWEDVHNYIGPPLNVSFARDFPKEMLEIVISAFREYYFVKGVYENELYDGIFDLIHRLHDEGFIIATATSKQQKMASEVINYFNLTEYVDRVFAADDSVGRRNKSDIVDYALRELRVDKEDAVLVGDTDYDIEGADAVGIDNIIVSWGFHDEGIEDRAMKYVTSCDELYDYLTK